MRICGVVVITLCAVLGCDQASPGQAGNVVCDLCWSADHFTNENPGIHRVRFEASSAAKPLEICATGTGPMSIALAHIRGPGSKAILGRASSEADSVCLTYDDFVFEPTELKPGLTYEITVITDRAPTGARAVLETMSTCDRVIAPLDRGGGGSCAGNATANSPR
jgi:hypothetical protein